MRYFRAGFMTSAGFGQTTEASSLKSPASGSNSEIIVGRRTGSGSQAKPRLAPKALPISEDEIKPRRLAPEAVASGDVISPRRAVEAR